MLRIQSARWWRMLVTVLSLVAILSVAVHYSETAALAHTEHGLSAADSNIHDRDAVGIGSVADHFHPNGLLCSAGGQCLVSGFVAQAETTRKPPSSRKSGLDRPPRICVA